MDKQSSPPPPAPEAKSIDHIKRKPVGWCKSSDGVKCQTNTHYFVELQPQILQPQILRKKNVGFGNVTIKKMNLDLSRFIDDIGSTKKTINKNQPTPKKETEIEGISREIQGLDPKSVQISDMWENSIGEKIYLLTDMNNTPYLLHHDEIKRVTSGGRSSNRKKRGKRTKKRKSRKRKSLYNKKKSKRRRRKKRKTRKKRKKY